MSVLILAEERDPSADTMVLALEDRGAQVYRLNTTWFPTQLSVSARLRGGRWSGHLRTAHHVVDLEEITAVWYRSPKAYQFPAELNTVEAEHAKVEAKYGLGGVLMSLPVLWVNHPARLADSGYKPFQLTIGARCGLRVADTLITNDPNPVRAFVNEGKTVTKMLGTISIPGRYLDISGDQRGWTVRLDRRRDRSAAHRSVRGPPHERASVTTTTGMDWTTHARHLADLLRERGDIRSPQWHAAIAAVPRHLFVPCAYEQDDTGQWTAWDTAEHWDRVYAPVTLVTALDDRRGYPEPVSSSTNPELMVRMLETLDVQDGHHVLEIGTGTGYNAALLCHRLGDDRVFSVDIDAELVALARERLAAEGYRPTLAAVDGQGGLSEHAPYDQIIATCTAATLAAPDGSWARISLADRVVTEAGETPLWSSVERAHQLWVELGEPTWDRLGLTVTPDGHHDVWLDDPSGDHRWTFPTVQ